MATSPDSTILDSPQSENSPPKHSPLPWAYDEDDARIYYDDGDVQPTIAYVERDGVAPEQVKADGYLIAAAPALLSALKTLVADLDDAEESFNPETGMDYSTVRLARAAIAKAAGAAHG